MAVSLFTIVLLLFSFLHSYLFFTVNFFVKIYSKTHLTRKKENKKERERDGKRFKLDNNQEDVRRIKISIGREAREIPIGMDVCLRVSDVTKVKFDEEILL